MRPSIPPPGSSSETLPGSKRPLRDDEVLLVVLRLIDIVIDPDKTYTARDNAIDNLRPIWARYKALVSARTTEET